MVEKGPLMGASHPPVWLNVSVCPTMMMLMNRQVAWNCPSQLRCVRMVAPGGPWVLTPGGTNPSVVEVQYEGCLAHTCEVSVLSDPGCSERTSTHQGPTVRERQSRTNGGCENMVAWEHHTQLRWVSRQCYEAQPAGRRHSQIAGIHD